MKQLGFLILTGALLGFMACKKTESINGPFYTNSFALQNDSNQQFIYTLERLPNDSLWLHFEAYTNEEPLPGIIDFYVLFTDTLDTLWIDSTARYGYTIEGLIGDQYKLDTSAINYVIIEDNLERYDLSTGIFQARFLIDTSETPKIDTLSPDTMRLENGSFSGTYIQ